MTIKIGTWHEKEARDVVQHTSYAADAINVRTKPGDYNLTISFKTGYSVPMPDMIHGGIDAEVTGGGYYSGFGGVNHGFTPAELGPTTENINAYSYHIASYIEKGLISVDPEWLWLAEDIPWEQAEAPNNWDELRKMKELSEYRDMLAAQDPEKSLEQGGEFPIASEPLTEVEGLIEADEALGKAIDEAVVALSEQRNNLEHSSKAFFGSELYGAVQEIRIQIEAAEKLLKRLAD